MYKIKAICYFKLKENNMEYNLDKLIIIENSTNDVDVDVDHIIQDKYSEDINETHKEYYKQPKPCVHSKCKNMASHHWI